MPRHATLPLWADATPSQQLEKLRHQVEDLYRYQLGTAIDAIIAQIEGHPAADEKEARDAAFIVQMCRQHPNILNMNCEPGHLTGSALIVDPRGRRVLLNHHAKLNRWMQFGGHFDYETEPHRVALREAQEESGLLDLRFAQPGDPPLCFDIDAHEIPARADRPRHWHLDLRYVLLTDSPELARATAESNTIRWCSFDEAAALDLSSEMQRMLRKASLLTLT
jgi:8-oxo-dGTP pyrophosphatase MutT (NUDIX family)